VAAGAIRAFLADHEMDVTLVVFDRDAAAATFRIPERYLRDWW
jgi:hypothetical protein